MMPSAFLHLLPPVYLACSEISTAGHVTAKAELTIEGGATLYAQALRRLNAPILCFVWSLADLRGPCITPQ